MFKGKCHLSLSVPIRILMPMHGRKEDARVALRQQQLFLRTKSDMEACWCHFGE
jgi:hypothetical protein